MKSIHTSGKKSVRHTSSKGSPVRDAAGRWFLENLEGRRLLASVATDKLDYGFGETAHITADGFAVGASIQFQVVHAEGTAGSNDDAQNQAWTVQDGGTGDLDAVADGKVVTTWLVDDPDAPGATYTITATGNLPGEIATATFTDSILVNTTTPNEQQIHFETSRAVAFDAAGNSVVVWSGRGTQAGNDDTIGVFAQRFNAAGAKIGGEVRINTTTANEQQFGTIAMKDNGDFVVVWSSKNSGNWDIRARRFSYDGAGNIVAVTTNGTTNDFVVNTTTGGDQHFASVAMDSTGAFAVAWRDEANTRIRFQRFTSAGLAVGGQTDVVNNSDAKEPSIGMADGGQFVVAWRQAGTIRAQRYTAAGVTNGLQITVASTNVRTSEAYPSVGMDAVGNFVVIWRHSNNNQIRFQRFDAAGAPQGVATDVNANGGFEVKYAAAGMNASGSFAVSWWSNEDNATVQNKPVSVRQYDAGGSVVRTETLVHNNDDNGDKFTSVGISDTGRLAVVWSGKGPGDSSGVFVQFYAAVEKNDAPSGADKTITINEDGSHTFTTGDFGFSDTADVPPNNLHSVKVTTLPAAGSLTLNGFAVSAGQLISAADINAGLLVFTPAANANGTPYASFTFQVKDDGGTANGGVDTDPTPNTITFNVTAANDAPAVAANNAGVTVNEGQPAANSGTYSDLDGDTVSITASIGTVTKTGTSSGTWSWSYTPADGPVTSTVTITADDGNGGVATTTFNLTVNNVAPTLTISGAASINEGSTYTLNLTETDPGDDTITSWTINWGDGSPAQVVTGNPSSVTHVYADGPNSYTISGTATDEDGTFNSNNLGVTVNNVAPSVARDQASVTVNEGQTATNTGTWSDPGVDVVTLSASIGTVVKNANGTWSWSYASTDGPDQSQTVTTTATDDDGASSSTTFALVVNNVAPAVAANNGTVIVNEGAAANNTGTWSDAGNDVVTLTASVGTVTKNADGTWSWSLNTTDGPDDSDTVTITATDSDGASSSASFELTVNNVAPTVLISGPASANEGETKHYTFTTTDPGADTFTLFATLGGSVGTVSNVTFDSATGTGGFDVTFNDGPASSVVSVQVKDSDGAASNISSINVAVANVAPSVAVANATVTVNEGQTATNTGTWSDPGNDTVTLAASKGTVIQNANGTWSWSFASTDGPDDSGPVTITATDSDGAATPTTFDLVVNNLAPSVAANQPTVTVSEGQTAGNSGTFSDPGADVVTITASRGTILQSAGASGTWTWSLGTTDGPDDGGTITITATDSDGAVTTTTFQLVVNNVAPTVTLFGPAAASEGQTKHYTFTTNDPGDDTFEILATLGGEFGVVSNVAFDSNTGVGSFDVTFTDGPSSSAVKVQVKDSDGAASNIETIDVAVANVAPTLTISGAASVDEGSTYTLNLAESDPGDDTITSWTINWGDGSPAQVVSGNPSSVTHVYADGANDYTISATATDEDGTFPSNTLGVHVNNVPPAVTAAAGQSTDEGTANSFDLGSFTDPAGAADAPYKVTVDWGDGSTDTTFNVSSPGDLGSQSHTYADNGNYTVTVTVTEDAGGGASGSASFTASVANVAPTVNAGADATVDEGSTFTSSGSFTDPGADTWTATVDYGDGTGPQPLTLNGDKTFDLSHVYADNGTYTVTVTVTDDDGGVDTDTALVTVDNVAPQNVDAGADRTVDEGDTVSLSGTFTDPGTADTHTFLWQVTASNGQVIANGTGPTFSFVPNDNGTYTVTFTVTDDDGGATSDTVIVTANNVNPTAAIAGAPATSDEGSPISLTGSATDPGSADTHTFEWSVTKNGNPYTTGAGTSFSFTPDDNGTYVVTLTATDDDFGTGTDTKTITVNNVAPQNVDAGPDQTVNEGSLVTLNGTFTDPGAADTHTQTWSVTASNGQVIANGTGPSYSFTPHDNGTYTVTYTVTDDDGASTSDTAVISVNNVAPTATITGAPAGSPEGTPITLGSSVTDPGSADTHTYAWTVTKNGTAYGSGSGTSFSFTPDDNGTYVVTLTVTDDDGGVGGDTATINVTNVAPNAAITGAPSSSNEGTPITLGSTVTDPGSADTHTYAWSVTKDGVAYASGTAASFTFTPDDNGTYVVTLTVTDDDGGADSDTKTINVLNVAPTLTISGAASVNEGSTYTLNLDSEDPGADTIMGWTINWGDGNVQVVTGNPSSVTHVYADGPNGYTISATATDEDGTFNSNSIDVTVNNVAPTATNNGYSTGHGTLVTGNVITDGTPDSDPAGTFDPLSIVGHTNPANGTLTINADGTFTYQPFSTFSGSDTFTYTIGDGDGGTSTATVTINVGSPAPTSILSVVDTCIGGTALVITGTAGADHIVVNPGASGDTLKISINGVEYVVARPSGRIIVLGGAGDDNIQIAGSVTNTVWAYGEAGNDRIFGGGGASLLIGGTGNDQLTGGSGRDVMIGGNGADHLIGNSGDDILVAGITTYDERTKSGHEVFFCGIMHEWTSSNAFMTRVNNLRNGTGGNGHNNGSFFNDGTISDDDDLDCVDMLNGSAGNDWMIFTKNEDKLVGQVEASNTVT